MGGKNCVIVDSDADLDEVVPDVVHSAFTYAGQKCSAASRLLVHDAIADRLRKRPDRRRRGADSGPGLDEGDRGAAGDRGGGAGAVDRYAAMAAAEGRIAARRTTRCPARWFCAPTLAVDLPPDSGLLREETSVRRSRWTGWRASRRPARWSSRCRSPSRAVSLSRATRPWWKRWRRSPVGNLYVEPRNHGRDGPPALFGGNRRSGIGSKAGGPDYLLQFVEPRVLTEKHDAPRCRSRPGCRGVPAPALPGTGPPQQGAPTAPRPGSPLLPSGLCRAFIPTQHARSFGS